jgi:hypothetical protein
MAGNSTAFDFGLGTELVLNGVAPGSLTVGRLRPQALG